MQEVLKGKIKIICTIKTVIERLKSETKKKEKLTHDYSVKLAASIVDSGYEFSTRTYSSWNVVPKYLQMFHLVSKF